VTIYDPQIERTPGGYRFYFPIEKVQIAVKRLSDDRRSQSTSAEVDVVSMDPAATGHIHQTRINLTSTQSKNSLVKKLTEYNEAIGWDSIVEDLCYKTLELHRQGEPLQDIGDNPLSGGIKYRLWPMCPEGMPALIFGEGGTGKSFLAILAAILVQSGHIAVGLRPVQGNALYLDYETSAETQNERVRAICSGLGIPNVHLAYRYCYHPLAEDIETIQDMVHEKDISFLVVDSLGPACGGDPNEAELAIRMFNCLRQLRISCLLIDHVAKNLADGVKASPYGSVYKTNLARSIWQIKPSKQTEASHTRMALYHRKVNFGPLRSALGFDLTFRNDAHEQLLSMSVVGCAVEIDPELLRGLPIKERVKKVLLAEGHMTTDELCLDLDLDKKDLAPRLSEMKKAMVIGLWEDKWGLLDLRDVPV
jgi:hypothetical protein